MLYSESADQPASMMIDSAFRATVAQDTARHVVIYSEYLDQSRYPDAQTQGAHQAWLREKYRGRNLNAVVAIGGLAVSTMMDAETTIAPGKPLMVWVNEHAAQRWLRPNAAVTGVVVQHDVSGTVRDALRLFPGTRELVVVSGSAPADSLLLLETRTAMRPFQDRLSVRYLVGLSQAGLERETAVLRGQTLLLYLDMRADATGASYSTRTVAAALTAATRAPAFALSNIYLGTGIVGGRLLDYNELAGQLATMTLRVLRGEPAARISMMRKRVHDAVFDARALRRFDVPRRRLPSDSRRISSRGDWWRHASQSSLIVGLCLLEALFITVLWLHRRQRDHTEHLLADRLRFETILADMARTFSHDAGEPVQVQAELQRWLGRIGVTAGARMVALLRLEESGTRLEPVLEWRAARRVQALVFAMGRAEIDCIRAGTVSSRPVTTPHGEQGTLILVPLVTAGATWGALVMETESAWPFGGGVPSTRLGELGEVLANALERSRATQELRERTHVLRESHAEYRRLADRLIDAQENEHRRIARELHDDITQRLTLIGVEAGEIGRADTSAVPGPAIERLTEELSALIGDVTRLSHRLHPSLLERVGLSAALRALCQELSGQQGMTVWFSEQNVPPLLPESVSLAAYRVAQEALRNALKHGGAKRAGVQIRMVDDMLALDITDDGQGFDMHRPDEGDPGLLSMTERVHVLEGTLTVRSEPGSGTTVHMELPLTRSDPAGTLPRAEARSA